MKKELLRFIRENELSPFSRNKTQIKYEEKSFFKTKDGKQVYNKVISTLSSRFSFSDSSNLFGFFEFTSDKDKIKERQAFFSQIKEKIENSFMNEIKIPKNWWNPRYGIIVVTEDEKTYGELQKISCPTRFLITESDLDSLDDYDIVQVIDCENFSRALESLPQTIFLDSTDEVYLERYVQILSGWKNNLEILKENKTNYEIECLVNEIYPLIELLDDKKSKKIKREEIEIALVNINKSISEQIKGLTVSGESLFTMLSKSTLPDELIKIVHSNIKMSELPTNLFTKTIPVEIDEEELDNILKKQNAEEHTSIAERIKKNADLLRKIPSKFKEISDELLLFDFLSGISNFIEKSKNYPVYDEELHINNCSNLFLENAQAISFNLNSVQKCSILTGANSGGKTTLLENIIQLICLFQIGLPASGEVKMPLFSEIYYFAKNKGSMNKGAFETLLSQMSKIKPGKNTLILADEIESVTEPGVAGEIISASADFFIKKGCFLIIATHLGKEIQVSLPEFARIDGIEAKGLDENYELIVDHNPVLGRLANSTPELIVEKMANTFKTDYFIHLFESLKKNKN